MKNTIFVAALVGACMLAVGNAAAQTPRGPEPGYVAGFSPNLVDPQPDQFQLPPDLKPTLYTDANRLIRWRGWLDVDAFSHSVLEQMQKQLGTGIEIGKFTIAEPAIAKAVREEAEKDATFRMNPNLATDRGEDFIGEPKFYVWTYRHNHTDTGLYQLYISLKGRMLIGEGSRGEPIREAVLHKDIQSLRYEFGPNRSIDGFREGIHPIHREIEIWRGAVVRVNARGVMEVVGNEAGVFATDEKGVQEGVEKAPIVDWERAPSLIDNPIYNPKAATGAEYGHPADRELVVPKAAGDVQAERRVQTFNYVPHKPASPPFRFRGR